MLKMVIHQDTQDTTFTQDKQATNFSRVSNIPKLKFRSPDLHSYVRDPVST